MKRGTVYRAPSIYRLPTNECIGCLSERQNCGSIEGTMYLTKGVCRMRTFGKLATGIAAVALLSVVNVGCATQHGEMKDTWTDASNRSSQSASRAEDAAKRSEAAAARVEAASKKCEDAAARIEAMTTKGMRK